jgi:hypothetical protein
MAGVAACSVVDPFRSSCVTPDSAGSRSDPGCPVAPSTGCATAVGRGEPDAPCAVVGAAAGVVPAAVAAVVLAVGAAFDVAVVVGLAGADGTALEDPDSVPVGAFPAGRVLIPPPHPLTSSATATIDSIARRRGDTEMVGSI